MQVSSDSLNDAALNLSVSGASIEDMVALAGEAVAKLRPKRVLISADPWLFNKNNDQQKWRTIAPLHQHWLTLMADQVDIRSGEYRYFQPTGTQADAESLPSTVFDTVNMSRTLVATDRNIEAVAKKAYDGFHIYGENYVATTQSEMIAGFGDLRYYGMRSFDLNDDAQAQFKHLVNWLNAQDIDVYFVLSPYHPGLYERLHNEAAKVLEMERVYQQFAVDLGATIVGSYDPSKMGCPAEEFYDGMHPTEGCMKKVLTPLR